MSSEEWLPFYLTQNGVFTRLYYLYAGDNQFRRAVGLPKVRPSFVEADLVLMGVTGLVSKCYRGEIEKVIKRFVRGGREILLFDALHVSGKPDARLGEYVREFLKIDSSLSSMYLEPPPTDHIVSLMDLLEGNYDADIKAAGETCLAEIPFVREHGFAAFCSRNFQLLRTTNSIFEVPDSMLHQEVIEAVTQLMAWTGSRQRIFAIVPFGLVKPVLSVFQNRDDRLLKPLRLNNSKKSKSVVPVLAFDARVK